MARNGFFSSLFPALIGDEQERQQLQFLTTRKPVPAAKCGLDTFGRPYLSSIDPMLRRASTSHGNPVISAILRTASGIRRIGEYDETRAR